MHPVGHHQKERAPGPAFWQIPSLLSRLRRDSLGTLTEIWRAYGDCVHFRYGPLKGYLINDADFIQHVLKDNHANYVKSRNYEKLRPLLGKGLLMAEGEEWRRQRRLAQPIFHQKNLEGLFQTMSQATDEHLRRWETFVAVNHPIDIAAEMMHLTLDVVCRCLFSIDISYKARLVGEALAFSLVFINRRVLSLLPTPLWLPTAANRRFARELATLNQVVFGIIEEHRKNPEAHVDLLSMFLAAKDEETGRHMNDLQVRDEVMTLLLAGHETTANALSWTFYLLSQHPQIEERVREEIKKALGDRAVTFEDLHLLPYGKMVLEEAMRLYPPAYIIERSALAADRLGAFEVRPGDMILMCNYVTHRHPKHWPDPETFDPERFLPETNANRHRFAYYPFGGGTRHCIGMGFATTEAQLILTKFLQRFTFTLLPGQTIVPQAKVTLRPKDGILMRLAMAE